jgi:hypothetical protein
MFWKDWRTHYKAKNGQNLQKYQFNNVLQHGCKFFEHLFHSIYACSSYKLKCFLQSEIMLIKHGICIKYVICKKNPLLVKYTGYLPSSVKGLHAYKKKKNIISNTMIFKLNCWVSKNWKTQRYSLKGKMCLLLLEFCYIMPFPLVS